MSDTKEMVRLSNKLQSFIRLALESEKECGQLRLEVSSLKAENERLRKAGDAMVSRIEFESRMADDDWGVDIPEVNAWNAAKEVQP